MGGILKQYLWVVDVIAALLCAFFGAEITHVYIAKLLEVRTEQTAVAIVATAAPAEEESGGAGDFKIVIDRDVFDSSDATAPATGTDAATEEKPIPTGEAVKTQLGIKIFGVLVVGSGTDARSSATVQGSGGKSALDTYAVGDENGFAPNTKLTKVRPDRIEFVNNGRLEYALLEEAEAGNSIFGAPETAALPGGAVKTAEPQVAGAPTVKPIDENKFAIDQSEVDNALKNLDQLYTDIRAVPNFAGGKVSGMKILSVKAGSIFDKLGLKRGDILERINGVELDVKQGFQIFSQLKDEKKFTLDLVRQGQNQTLEYEVR